MQHCPRRFTVQSSLTWPMSNNGCFQSVLQSTRFVRSFRWPYPYRNGFREVSHESMCYHRYRRRVECDRPRLKFRWVFSGCVRGTSTPRTLDRIWRSDSSDSRLRHYLRDWSSVSVLLRRKGVRVFTPKRAGCVHGPFPPDPHKSFFRGVSSGCLLLQTGFGRRLFRPP